MLFLLGITLWDSSYKPPKELLRGLWLRCRTNSRTLGPLGSPGTRASKQDTDDDDDDDDDDNEDDDHKQQQQR